MAKVHFVKSARKADKAAGISKGDSYWWWKFRFGGKHKSKTRPRPSQLTRSEFWSTYYSVQESAEDETISTADELQELIDNARSQLEDLASEQEEKLSNMPDQLQDSETGQMLQERFDALNDVIGYFDNVETEPPDEIAKDEDQLSVWLDERKQEILDNLSDLSCS